MHKEFAKLTAANSRELIHSLPVVLAEAQKLPAELQAVSQSRVNELLPGNPNWARLYELTFFKHLVLFIHIMNLGEYVKDLAAAPLSRRPWMISATSKP